MAVRPNHLNSFLLNHTETSGCFLASIPLRSPISLGKVKCHFLQTRHTRVASTSLSQVFCLSMAMRLPFQSIPLGFAVTSTYLLPYRRWSSRSSKPRAAFRVHTINLKTQSFAGAWFGLGLSKPNWAPDISPKLPLTSSECLLASASVTSLW